MNVVFIAEELTCCRLRDHLSRSVTDLLDVEIRWSGSDRLFLLWVNGVSPDACAEAIRWSIDNPVGKLMISNGLVGVEF